MLMLHRKLNFIVFDRNVEFRSTFQSLLSLQSQNEQDIAIGTDEIYPRISPVTAMVVTDPTYLQSDSLNLAVSDLGVHAIVSPGNSFGLMEGGFDLTISQYYLSLFSSLESDQLPAPPVQLPSKYVSAAVQSALLNEIPFCMAYNPVQRAIRIPASELLKRIRTAARPTKLRELDENTFVPDLVHLPTMATPAVINLRPTGNGNEQRLCDSIIFNSTWNLMAELARTHLYADFVENSVLNVVLTGLGTGVGNVPPKIAALHMFKAIFYYTKVMQLRYSASSSDSKDSEEIAKYVQTKIQAVVP